MKFKLLFFFAFVMFAGCSTDNILAPLKPAYFPLNIGRYMIYKVDSVRYSSGTIKKPDTIHYYLKDTITSSFKDQTGQLVYRIEEYRRNKITDLWIISKVFTRSFNSLYAEQVNGNIRYVKMLFPVGLNQSWNPNMYNTLDSERNIVSQYIEVNKPYSVQGLKFDYTALVQLQNDSNLVNYYKYYERYAANVGLISIRHDSVFHHIQPPNPNYDEGYRISQTLSDYGPR